MNPIASVLLAFANAPATTQGADPPPAGFSLFSSPLVIITVLFLLGTMLFGGKGKRGEEKARVEMLKQLKRGDRIQTIGGILGAVVRAEPDRVEVKVDEGSNVKIWFARTAISKVVEADKGDAK